MSVTAFIRDYVTEEMKKKFQPAIDAVMPEYIELRERLIESCSQIAKRADEEVKALCREAGMWSGTDFPIVQLVYTHNIHNKAMDDERSKKISELTKKRDQAVRDILLKLEIGETSKNDLKAAIDEVVVE